MPLFKSKPVVTCVEYIKSCPPRCAHCGEEYETYLEIPRAGFECGKCHKLTAGLYTELIREV